MDIFFNTYNPLFFILIIGVFVITILYLVITQFFIPMERMHRAEKNTLELQAEKMKALFTQFAPNPIFRFDFAGKVLLTNEAGLEVFKNEDPRDKNLKDLIPSLRGIDLRRIITEVQEYSLDATILDKEYHIIIKGVPEFDFGHMYCFDITERVRYERELEQTKHKLSDLALGLQDLRESDRNSVAMELHDNICQRLSSIRLAVESYNPKNFTEETAEQFFGDIIRAVDDMIVDTRELSYTLKPKFLGEFGLVAALESLVDQTRKKTGLKGIFKHYGFDSRLEPKLEVYIYRIIQELLSNILRHSGASFFVVQIFRNNESVKLLVQDNGIGVDAATLNSNRGLGLVNIKERVETFNGTFSYETQPNHGTEFIIELPAA